jgi:superfamily I DNA and/or RNA helicase
VIDEASMMTGPDLADLISLADGRGGKVIVAGDTGQLRAGRNGSCF